MFAAVNRVGWGGVGVVELKFKLKLILMNMNRKKIEGVRREMA